MRTKTFILLGLVLALSWADAAATPPLTCTDPCHVESSIAGYNLPAIYVANNSEVEWSSIDILHRQTDTAVKMEPNCFNVAANAIQDSPPVRFHIEDGSLYATAPHPLTGVEATIECKNAQALPDGSFALAYGCTLHPNMHGAIVVSA